MFKCPCHGQVWHRFLQEIIQLAQKLGGRGSLTQTRFLTRESFLAGPGTLPLIQAPNGRFTSAFYAQFLAEMDDNPQVTMPNANATSLATASGKEKPQTRNMRAL